MKEIIAEILAKELGTEIEKIINLIETPPKEEMGDFSFPCFSLAKKYKKSPLLIAKELGDKLRRMTLNEISNISSDGGYVNFFLNKQILVEKMISKMKNNSWWSVLSEERSVLIEFSQPNTHKAFHVGHIRGTSIGESLSRIFESAGNKVTRVNYSGDSGMHIAKWIWYYSKYLKGEKLKKDESWIAKIYVNAIKKMSENKIFLGEVESINKKIELKDEKINKLWEESRTLSIKSWEKIYKELGTNFQKHYFESELEEEAKEIVYDLLEKGIAKKDDGAVIVDLRKYGLSVWVLLRKDGTVLYSAKDIALALRKFKEYPRDYYLVTVGDEQTLHFKQLQKVLELMKVKDAAKYNFLPFGMIRLPTGKMSSRTGQNILYSDFILEIKKIAEDRIKDRIDNISKNELEKRSLKLAIASIKYSMLKQDIKKNIIFDPKVDVSFEGNTGPYLLYSYARANSILNKCKDIEKKKMKIIDINPKESSLIKKIYTYREMVVKSYNQQSPSVVANYSYELSKVFNEFYHECPVINSIQEKFRFELVRCFKNTLEKSLELLGIEPLETM